MNAAQPLPRYDVKPKPRVVQFASEGEYAAHLAEMARAENKAAKLRDLPDERSRNDRIGQRVIDGVFKMIRENPGILSEELKARMPCSTSSTQMAAKLLTDEGKVTRTRVGKGKIYAYEAAK